MPDLQFQCLSGCTNCCEQKGYVYLSEGDVVKAARFLKMTPGAFEKQYVYRTRHRLRLRQPAGSHCHFLASGRCTIHPAKPTQCRLFPFWPELVEHPAQWKAVGGYCPGIGHGDLVQIGSAIEIASEMRSAYPALYPRAASGKTSSSS